MNTKKAWASAVSGIIARDTDFFSRRLVHSMQSGDEVIVYTYNGARHQAAALSRGRRALLRKGYVVETFHGKAPLMLARHAYYLVVRKELVL